MKIKFFGAAQTVTGSRILFEHYHFKVLIDCGLFQGPRFLRDLNWQDQPELLQADCVILTHAHIDHSGFLPRLYKLGYRKPIYCTKATKELIKIMLMDSAKLQEEDAKFANSTQYSEHNPAVPLYDESDVKGCLSLLQSFDWNHWTALTPQIGFKFVRSGHILGAASIQVQYSHNQVSKILTFSGDLGTERSQVLRNPDPITETDALVIESTYGNRALTYENIENQLAEIIRKIYSQQGTLLIPAFAVGRTQDLLLLIKRLHDKKLIPKVPVYLDSPMAHEVTKIYLRYQDELQATLNPTEIEEALSEAVIRPVLSPDESMLLCMSTEPKIVISASGMLQGGRILHHLKAKLSDPNSGVLFVGYQAQGTKGRLLKEGLPTLRIHHKTIDVEASIFSIEGLSAHADSQELMAWLKRLRRPPARVLINHGEKEASEAFQYRIINELGWKNVIVPKQEELIDLDETS